MRKSNLPAYFCQEKIDLKFRKEQQHIFTIRQYSATLFSYEFCLNIHLGRYVIRRAAESLGGLVTGDAFLAHAKVCDFYVTVLIQQDIVKLEVTVDDAAQVQVEQADCYLRRVESVNV